MTNRTIALIAAIMAAAVTLTACAGTAENASSAAQSEAAQDSEETAAEETDAEETATEDETDDSSDAADAGDYMVEFQDGGLYKVKYDRRNLETFLVDSDNSVNFSFINDKIQQAGSNVVNISIRKDTTYDTVLKEAAEKLNIKDPEITEICMGAQGITAYSMTTGVQQGEGSELKTMDTFIAVPCGSDVVLLDAFRTIGTDDEAEMAIDDTFAQLYDTFELTNQEMVGGEGSVNPMTECASLDEMNEKAGGSMIYCPNDTAQDQKYFIIRTDNDAAPIAEYDYTLDGREYMVRFSGDFTAAISGIYGANGLEYSDSGAANWPDFSYVKGSDYYCAHWLTTDGQYIFAALNSADLDEKAFEQIADTYRDGTIRADN